MWTSWLFLALFVTVQGRAVNISNTWVLPEEGFPVFYRYFRDRISWYEADAVCQFHHANLVTVDTTAQYDAVRAYLKELDISTAVWVGLIRSNPDGDFTWTDYRGLSGEGYWSSAPDSRTAPLCAAADPTADYRWDARACGGPSVASFICELPVPQWALGNEGCMVKALPALTILYLPESAAVQLTTDCGLAGVRRVQCTGNVKRDDLLKDLSCTVDEQTSTTSNVHDTSLNWQVTTDILAFEQDNNDMTTENDITTRPENIEQDNSIKSTTIQDIITLGDQNQLIPNQYETDSSYKNVPNLNIIENNSLYNNIPSIIVKDDLPSTEYADKLENERHIQHKLIHDELARLGNLETIFNQPTDHFIPPLVIAKAKLSNDMIAMSFEEKLAQEHEGYQFMKHSNDIMNSINMKNEITTESPKYKTTDNVLINIMHSTIHDSKDKEYTKKVTPKKYNPKHTKVLDAKQKSIPTSNFKKSDNISLTSIPMTSTIGTAISSDEHIYVPKRSYTDESDETSIELTVVIREPTNLVNYIVNNTFNDTGFKTIEASYEFLNSTELHDIPNEKSTVVTLPDIIVLNDEIINITFNTNHVTESTPEPILSNSEISTKSPIFKDDSQNFNSLTTEIDLNFHGNLSFDSYSNLTYIRNNLTDISVLDMNDVSVSTESSLGENSSIIDNNSDNSVSHNGPLESKMIMTNVTQDLTPNIDMNETLILLTAPTEQVDSNIEQHLNSNSSEEDIDDFQSPLLSGADEPVHKSIRARRPQSPQNRGKKFNPFRILG